LEILDRLNPTIAELTHAIEAEVEKYPAAQRLMTHPGVGALTALAFVLIIGEEKRFQCGKQIAAYLGLVFEQGSQQGLTLDQIIKVYQSVQQGPAQESHENMVLPSLDAPSLVQRINEDD
jgi:transposase